MKKLSPQEFDALPLHGQGRSSIFFNSIAGLKIDESIMIDKKEWGPKKYTPLRMVNKISRKFNMKFISGALPDRSGWAIKRVK